MLKNYKKERIIFQTDKGPVVIVSNILKKYGLEESLRDAYKKIKRKEKPRVTAVIEKIKDLIFKNISERDLLLFLEKELSVNNEASKKILEDIKKDLLVLAKIVPFKKSTESRDSTNELRSSKPSVAVGLEEK